MLAQVCFRCALLVAALFAAQQGVTWLADQAHAVAAPLIQALS